MFVRISQQLAGKNKRPFSSFSSLQGLPIVQTFYEKILPDSIALSNGKETYSIKKFFAPRKKKYPREDEHLGIGYLVDDKLKFEPKKYLSSIHYR